MVPVGAIVGALVILVRVLSKASTNAATPAKTTPVSRASVSFFSDSGVGFTVILQVILFPIFVGGVITGFAELAPLSLAWGLFCGTFVFPWALCRRVLIPLGLARITYRIAGLSRVTWRRDKPGGPAFAGALALVHQERPSPSAIAWLEARLERTPSGKFHALQGSTVGAWALLAAAKGDLEGARRMFTSMRVLDPVVVAPFVRRTAGEWLATDAAAAGDWETVRRICADTFWGGSRKLWLLGALARRVLSDPTAPSGAGLWIYWLAAPRRLWTWSFVRRVSRLPLTPPKPQAAVSWVGRGESLEVALGQHVALPARPNLGELGEVAKAWDAALTSPRLTERLAGRVVALGGGDLDGVLERLKGAIEEELGARVEEGSGGAGSAGSGLLEQALQRRRDALHDQLEQQIALMDERKLAKRELPVIDEWREVAQVHARYHELIGLGGLEERRLAHSVIRDRLVNFGVWLFNVRDEKPLANAIFKFLWAEALALGDEEAAKLNEKNAKCGI